ncbi:hypothetical protein D3C86_1509380 [compost metagenome]
MVCEKLYPNYLYFQSRCNWGDSSVLLGAIEIMYQSLFKSVFFDDEEIEQCIYAVDAVTPDTEGFLDSSVSLALDACTAVYSSLNFMHDQEVDHIIAVAIYARDTVYMSIINKDGLDMNLKGIDAMVLDDPLMIKEIARQFSIIEELESLKDENISDELIQRHKAGPAIIDLKTLK